MLHSATVLLAHARHRELASIPQRPQPTIGRLGSSSREAER
jgi:hypothetical protein